MDETTKAYYDLINAQQQANNEWSAQQAQKAMDYQTEMSNTAHQREVKDLIAAGLNPILSAGGSGATTGSGIAASAGDGNVTALYGLAKQAIDANMKQAEAMASQAKSVADASAGKGSGKGSGSGSGKGSGSDESDHNVLETVLADILYRRFGISRDATYELLGYVGDLPDLVEEGVSGINNLIGSTGTYVASLLLGPLLGDGVKNKDELKNNADSWLNSLSNSNIVGASAKKAKNEHDKGSSFMDKLYGLVAKAHGHNDNSYKSKSRNVVK